MTTLTAIKRLEEACLAPDCPRTTAASMREAGPDDTEAYYGWLRRQASWTAIFLPLWGDLTHKPKPRP